MEGAAASLSSRPPAAIGVSGGPPAGPGERTSGVPRDADGGVATPAPAAAGPGPGGRGGGSAGECPPRCLAGARQARSEAAVSATTASASAERYEDFDVDRDYVRLRGPLLGLLRRDGRQISDDEWDAVWNAVCLNVWRRQQAAQIDFRGEPLNYLLASAKNELRRERRRARADVVSLDSKDVPEPSSPIRELDDELDMRDKLRLAHTIARHRLRPRELRVWGLRVVCGLTYEEGAERLGITPKRFEKELLSAHAKIADEIRAVAAGTWCESVKGVSLLRAYEAGVLDPDGDALRELREHAATCPACRRAIKTVEGIVPMLLPPAPVLLALSASAPDGDGHAERLMQHLGEDGGEVVTAVSPDPHPAVHAPSIVER